MKAPTQFHTQFYSHLFNDIADASAINKKQALGGELKKIMTERKEKDKKGSIRSGRDLGIALITLAIACSVIALITMPVMSSVLPSIVSAGNPDCESCQISATSIIGADCRCDTELELPPGSVIWLCQYLVYSNQTGQLIGIDLCDDDDWAEYGELITEITGLNDKEEWEVLYADMLYKKRYVGECYLPDQGFYVVSCLDCDCFWYLIDMANDCDCPVRIAMYDCCCVICPIIPVFVY